ncbi:2TM domain-containing protein [Kaistella flava (ex Peng et al. 2021)]|uniref:2TM domain-containing protein n=1 Tax=Kaistella flava (ex Peng et al. 2021) TaxID=2038776 RepID=A0A7M2YAJ3_9FLAO|nr:2TM domain-containing protein [Kaistella flava (ex Peng et al. 2021)]QOW11126.1 2TM domain-containing protein [Kaistella flava (ex Peng et al. 2021)]
MENFNQNNIKYLEAAKRVKRLKGFYIHAVVYVLVNLFIVAQNVKSGASLSNMDNYWTAIFWGVGLLGHGISVFLPNMIMGKDWEERKIRELMDKNK